MVMMIISVMAGFFVTNYPGMQKTARDTKRKSDLKQYQTSLERYANSNGGFFPSRTSQTYASDISGNPSLCTDLGLTQCPADPKDNQPLCIGTPKTCRYYYISDGLNGGGATASKFVLYAKQEKKSGSESYNYFLICSSGASGVRTSSWTPSSTCPL